MTDSPDYDDRYLEGYDVGYHAGYIDHASGMRSRTFDGDKWAAGARRLGYAAGYGAGWADAPGPEGD